MNIRVNGEVRQIAGPCTVDVLLDRMSLADRRLAVEVNEEIVPRSRFASFSLNEGDRVEIVHAIGGG